MFSGVHINWKRSPLREVERGPIFSRRSPGGVPTVNKESPTLPCICGRSISGIPGVGVSVKEDGADTDSVHHVTNQLAGVREPVSDGASTAIMVVSGFLFFLRIMFDFKKMNDRYNMKIEQEAISRQLTQRQTSGSERTLLQHRYQILGHQLRTGPLMAYGAESVLAYGTTGSNTVGNGLMVTGHVAAGVVGLGVSSILFLAAAGVGIIRGSVAMAKTFYASDSISISDGVDPELVKKGARHYNASYRIRRGMTLLAMAPVLPVYGIYKLVKLGFRAHADGVKDPFQIQLKWFKREDAAIKILGGTLILIGFLIPFAQPLVIIGIAILFAKPLYQFFAYLGKVLMQKSSDNHRDCGTVDEKLAQLQQNARFKSVTLAKYGVLGSRWTPNRKMLASDDYWKTISEFEQLSSRWSQIVSPQRTSVKRALPFQRCACPGGTDPGHDATNRRHQLEYQINVEGRSEYEVKSEEYARMVTQLTHDLDVISSIQPTLRLLPVAE